MRKRFYIPLILIILLFVYVGRQSPALQSQQNPLETASLACRELSKKTLHDPDSAKYEDYRTYYAKQEKGGEYTVQAHLRAKNAFGAYVKTVIECKLIRKDNGDFVLLSTKPIE